MDTSHVSRADAARGVIAWIRVTCAVDRGLVVLLGPHPVAAVAVIAWIGVLLLGASHTE